MGEYKDVIDEFRSKVPAANCTYERHDKDDGSRFYHRDYCYGVNCGYSNIPCTDVLSRREIIAYGKFAFRAENGKKNAIDWKRYSQFLRQCIQDYYLYLALTYNSEEIRELLDDHTLDFNYYK